MKRGVLVGLCMSMSCKSAVVEQPPHASNSGAHPQAATRWYGELRAIMHQGRTQAAVRLADALSQPHAWGLGALDNLDGEVTVLDDQVWFARPQPDGSARVVQGELGGRDREQGAALFVVANVAAWHTLTIAQRVPFHALDHFLETELGKLRRSFDAPIALRIEGPVALLQWHVVDGSKLKAGGGHSAHARAAVSGTVEQANAQLIGFFSKMHQGVFTHAGSSSHFHALLREPLLSGHVDGVELLPGARLFVADGGNSTHPHPQK